MAAMNVEANSNSVRGHGPLLQHSYLDLLQASTPFHFQTEPEGLL